MKVQQKYVFLLPPAKGCPVKFKTPSASKFSGLTLPTRLRFVFAKLFPEPLRDKNPVRGGKRLGNLAQTYHRTIRNN